MRALESAAQMEKARDLLVAERRRVADGLNVRQVEELVRALGVDDETVVEEPTKAKPVGETRPAALIELEEILGNHLSTRVHVSSGSGKGRLTVEYADLDDLNRIFRTITGG